MGRSSKALKNVFTGLVSKLLMLALAFAARTMFIRLLGAEYVGVSSLYTNILSVLSLAELGISNVLMYYLYSALNKHDEDKICALTEEFKKIYTAIIIVILTIGLLLIPLLKYIVHSNLNSTELITYYLLYLINSVASYFVVYRTMLLKADQNDYIASIVTTSMTVLMYVFQIGYLALFRDFLGYLIIQVLATIGNNWIQNEIALRKYPYVRKRASKEVVAVEKRDLFENVKATFLFKVSDTILDQTDSIIISIMFGTVSVGYYSNYYMLISYLVAVAGIIANGLVASFGSLNAEGNMEKSYQMFCVAMMGFAVFGAFCTVGFACVIQDFVALWVGKEYVMSYGLVFAILAVFYLRMITNTIWMYRSSMGLFKEVQYVNILAALLNLLLSVVMGKWIGVPGVIIATVISRLVTSFWYEAKIVYAKFDKKVSDYFGKQLKALMSCCFAGAVALIICKYVPYKGVLGITLKLLIALFVTTSVELVAYYRSQEFRTLLSKFRGIGKNILFEK